MKEQSESDLSTRGHGMTTEMTSKNILLNKALGLTGTKLFPVQLSLTGK